MTINNGSNRCYTNEPANYIYTWSLYNNDQSMRIDYEGGDFVNLTIAKVTLSKIELSGVDSFGDTWQYVFKQ